jgi:hypothetical protein
MRNVLLCLVFTSVAVVFGQSTPDNAAIDALKKRLLSMNLLNPAGPKPIMLAGPMTRPKVCAIPLLHAN